MGKRNNSHRRSFTAEFKLKVVQYSIKKSMTAAARMFQVSYKSVQLWKHQQKDLCLAVHSRKWRNGRGNILTETSCSIEQDLYNWVNDQMELYKQSHPDATSSDANLNGLVEDVNTTETVQTDTQSDNTNENPCNDAGPASAAEEDDDDLSDFHKNIRSLHAIHDYQLMDVGIVSETSVPFLKSNYTSHVTLVLCALADGTKLKPLVIFKGQDLPPSIKIPPDVHILVAKKGYPEEPEILSWLKHVWKLSEYQNHRLLVSSITSVLGQESLQSLAAQYCLTDVVHVPNGSNNSDFLGEMFRNAFQSRITCKEILECVNTTWKRLTERSIIDGFMDGDIVCDDDVYVKDDATDFLGFCQDDIDVAKETAMRVNSDNTDVINHLQPISLGLG